MADGPEEECRSLLCHRASGALACSLSAPSTPFPMTSSFAVALLTACVRSSPRKPPSRRRICTAQSTPRPMADGLWGLLIACFCGTLPCQGECWRCGEDEGWQLFAIYPVGASAAHFPGASVGLDALFTEWNSCCLSSLQSCEGSRKGLSA